MDYNKIIVVLSMIILVLIVTGIVIINPFAAKTDTHITVTSNNVLYKGDSFSISLTDVNNTPLSNQKINILIKDANGNSSQKTITTNENGEGELELNELSYGNYDIVAVYDGNNSYSGCKILRP